MRSKCDDSFSRIYISILAHNFSVFPLCFTNYVRNYFWIRSPRISRITLKDNKFLSNKIKEEIKPYVSSKVFSVHFLYHSVKLLTCPYRKLGFFISLVLPSRIYDISGFSYEVSSSITEEKISWKLSELSFSILIFMRLIALLQYKNILSFVTSFPGS